MVQNRVVCRITCMVNVSKGYRHVVGTTDGVVLTGRLVSWVLTRSVIKLDTIELVFLTDKRCVIVCRYYKQESNNGLLD